MNGKPLVLVCALGLWPALGRAADAPPDKVRALAAEIVALTANHVKWGRDSGLPPSLIVGKAARWVLVAVDRAQLPGADERAALDLAAKAPLPEQGEAVIQIVRKQVEDDQ